MRAGMTYGARRRVTVIQAIVQEDPTKKVQFLQGGNTVGHGAQSGKRDGTSTREARNKGMGRAMAKSQNKAKETVLRGNRSMCKASQQQDRITPPKIVQGHSGKSKAKGKYDAMSDRP